MANWIEWDDDALRWTIKLGFIKIKVRDKAKFKQRRLDFQKSLGNTPIVKNKIVFSNYFGKSYGCNPKYIADEIIRQNLPYELVWLVKNPEEHINEFPKEIRLVRYLSPESYKELASAKIWVDNTRKKPYWEQGLIKKKDQVYIQTWHGSLGIKKIEAAIKNENPIWRKWAKFDSQNIDYILANSIYDMNMFGKDFWYKGQILKTGHPRCDYFFQTKSKQEEIKNKVFETLKIDLNKKVILYVPTFRSDKDIDCFKINPEKVLETITGKFSNDWVFIVKLHPNINSSVLDNFNFNEKIINANMYPDTSDLLLSSDIVITDYSSCIFDFMFTQKPAFIFATDLEKYNSNRGFYYDLKATPFPISRSNNQLIENIQNFDNEKYKKELIAFLNKQECNEDGNSSKRTVEFIKKIIEGNNEE